MDLTPYADAVQRELALAAGDDVAERLGLSLDAAIRLTLLDALADAADEITRELAPGSVELRLRSRGPEFAVTAPPVEEAGPPPAPPAADEDGATARINLRLPEQLKTGAERAAAAERLSVNAWLVRAIGAAVAQGGAGAPPRAGALGQRFTGWVR